MRLLLCPDKFKRSLTATEAAEAMQAGARRALADLDIDLCPLSDGGEGFVSTMTRATPARCITRTVTGPLPEMKVDATFAILEDNTTAVIEMSSASGLALLHPIDQDPLATTSFGTGQLIRAAVEMGCRKILLGIGGSATCDAGVGCLQACGCHVILKSGEYATDTEPLCGRDLDSIQMIKSHRGGVVDGVEIVIACDVTNPLYGPEGSACVYGPQKGATPEAVKQLDRMLRDLSARMNQSELANRPGSGAAGGIGFGLAAMFDAKLARGIDIVFDAVQFEERANKADLILTGEGQLDVQSISGKTVGSVAAMAKRLGKPCVAIVGSVHDGAASLHDEGLTAAFSIVDRPMTLEEAIRDAKPLLEVRTRNVMKLALSSNLGK